MDQPDFECDNPYKPPTADLSEPESRDGGDDLKGTTRPVEGYPLLTVWIRPRATIRYILNGKSIVSLHLLAALSGIAFLLFELVNEENQNSYEAKIGYSIVFGPIVGIACMYINGFAMKWAGRFVGGKAVSKECRAAMCWAAIPEIVLGAISFGLWCVGTVSGIDIITNELIMLIADLSAFVFILWQWVLTLRALAEAHRIGSWRMLGGIVLTSVILIVLFLVLCLITGFILSMFGFVFPDAQ